jgi:DNA-binding NtrC family response regulator
MTVAEKKDFLASQRILVIDDDPIVCLSCSRILEASGHHVDCRQDPREGIQTAISGDYDVLFLDLVMPEMWGLEVLANLKQSGVATPVIIITGFSTVQTAVEAMRLGAADYVSKPFTPEELRLALKAVVERTDLLRENEELRRILRSASGFRQIVGQSRPMERVFSMIQKVAPTNSSVLIIGESGTGKELVARALHSLSERSDRPFLACDCSSLVPTLLESELFGHVKGSFSGAVGSKQGLFKVADGGTLFLDEVSNIVPEIQGKLLRSLETRRVKPVGGTEEVEVNIRLIAASNRDLKEMVHEGTFRLDLYYRLNVFPIWLPPLRERSGDVPLLLQHFLDLFREANPAAPQGFTPEAMQALEGYGWPGNIRELKNVVERMAILCDQDRISLPHLPPEVKSGLLPSVTVEIPSNWEEFKRYKKQISDSAAQDSEIRFLVEALARNNGNITQAAEDVGMQRTNFHFLIRKHGIKVRSD